MKKKRKRKPQVSKEEVFSDENFAFIAGYTSGGAPYGTTWEEVGSEYEKEVSPNVMCF